MDWVMYVVGQPKVLQLLPYRRKPVHSTMPNCSASIVRCFVNLFPWLTP